MKAKFKTLIKKLTHRNLLVIKVKDENSVPEVVYKGKKLKYKSNLKFYWDTRTDINTSGYDVEIAHYVKGADRRPGRVEKLGFKSPFRNWGGEKYQTHISNIHDRSSRIHSSHSTCIQWRVLHYYSVCRNTSRSVDVQLN